MPEYVVQGMLGRKKYLDQYMALPLADKQAFAKKILKVVSIYADKADKQEVVKQMAQIMGIQESDLDEAKIAAVQALFVKMGQFAKLPIDKIEQVNKLLGGQ